MYGSWSGLAVALGAAAGLDLLLLASFGWSELIGEGLRNTLWAALGVSWVLAGGWSARQCRRQAAAEQPDPRADPFTDALDHYLKGDYYQAEQVLEGLLRRNLRDVDARLMLATLLRHTERLDEAARQLDTLARLEGAGKWHWEIERERDLLAEARTEKATAA
jgi:cytochrome c-type biogenesis protein CcmH/NrfG